MSGGICPRGEISRRNFQIHKFSSHPMKNYPVIFTLMAGINFTGSTLLVAPLNANACFLREGRKLFCTLCAKNETRVIVNILYSCKSIAMKFST